MAEFTVLNTDLNPAGTFGFNWQARFNQVVQPTVGGGTTVVVQGGTSQTFFFRGFFPGSGQFEFWSGSSRNTPPPSGHSLVDVTVTGVV